MHPPGKELRMLSKTLSKHQQCLDIILVVLAPGNCTQPEKHSSAYLFTRVFTESTSPVKMPEKPNSRSDVAMGQDLSYKRHFCRSALRIFCICISPFCCHVNLLRELQEGLQCPSSPSKNTGRKLLMSSKLIIFKQSETLGMVLSHFQKASCKVHFLKCDPLFFNAKAALHGFFTISANISLKLVQLMFLLHFHFSPFISYACKRLNV